MKRSIVSQHGQLVQGRPQKRLFSIAETAEYLGRSVWSIRELIWAGKLPSVRVGKRIHLDIYDLDAFIEQNKVREWD